MGLEPYSSAKPATVVTLIARRKYGEAVAMLQEQVKAKPADTSIRIQLADVLVLQGNIDESIRTLEGVADDFAKRGLAAKAIAVLKKIQKLDPRRRDIEGQVIELFKSRTPTGTYGWQTIKGEDLEYNAMPAVGLADLKLNDAAQVAPTPMHSAAPEGFELHPPSEGDVVPPARDIFEPRRKLLSTDPGTLEHPVEAALHVDLDDIHSAPTQNGTTPIRLRSPLFDDFSEDELLQVVRGLELLSFDGGDIVLTEGEKSGDNLYVLTSGTAKAFVRNREGGSTQVRQLYEGDFFGEISILTGKPRTATVTAATACELLRLDRKTLDGIISTHPRVREVLQKFYDERANNAAEAEIRGLDAGSSETVRLAGLTGDAQTETIVITEEDLAEDSTEFRLQNMRKVAIEYSRKHNWSDAVQAWQQYLALKPLDADAANVLGVLFGKLGRWIEAAQTFERLVELNAKDPTVFFNLGLSYAQLDLLPQAARAYRHALALQPDYDKAKQNLSSVIGRIKKARGEAEG